MIYLFCWYTHTEKRRISSILVFLDTERTVHWHTGSRKEIFFDDATKRDSCKKCTSINDVTMREDALLSFLMCRDMHTYECSNATFRTWGGKEILPPFPTLLCHLSRENRIFQAWQSLFRRRGSRDRFNNEERKRRFLSPSNDCTNDDENKEPTKKLMRWDERTFEQFEERNNWLQQEERKWKETGNSLPSPSLRRLLSRERETVMRRDEDKWWWEKNGRRLQDIYGISLSLNFWTLYSNETRLPRRRSSVVCFWNTPWEMFPLLLFLL